MAGTGPPGRGDQSSSAAVWRAFSPTQRFLTWLTVIGLVGVVVMAAAGIGSRHTRNLINLALTVLAFALVAMARSVRNRWNYDYRPDGERPHPPLTGTDGEINTLARQIVVAEERRGDE